VAVAAIVAPENSKGVLHLAQRSAVGELLEWQCGHSIMTLPGRLETQQCDGKSSLYINQGSLHYPTISERAIDILQVNLRFLLSSVDSLVWKLLVSPSSARSEQSRPFGEDVSPFFHNLNWP